MGLPFRSQVFREAQLSPAAPAHVVKGCLDHPGSHLTEEWIESMMVLGERGLVAKVGALSLSLLLTHSLSPFTPSLSLSSLFSSDISGLLYYMFSLAIALSPCLMPTATEPAD